MAALDTRPGAQNVAINYAQNVSNCAWQGEVSNQDVWLLPTRKPGFLIQRVSGCCLGGLASPSLASPRPVSVPPGVVNLENPFSSSCNHRES